MHYNCLIVDDEIDLAKMTCEYFQMFDVSCGYVTTASESSQGKVTMMFWLPLISTAMII